MLPFPRCLTDGPYARAALNAGFMSGRPYDTKQIGLIAVS